MVSDESAAVLPPEAVALLTARVRVVRQRIAAAARRAERAPEAVLLVAVTKTVPPATIAAACALGVSTCGENRVQEASSKVAALAGVGIHWELIGHLQRNKAAQALDMFERIQSVDSLALAQTLSRLAAARGRTLPILLEVNVAGEASKFGFAPDTLTDAAREITRLPHLRPEGLMTVAPMASDPAAVRPIFRHLRALREVLRAAAPTDDGWPQLSMGMSDDFAVAIEEGATIVRLGRAIFGAR